MIYSTLYNPAIDVVYRVESISRGDTLVDTETDIHPAGKGLNVARSVRELGDDVSVVGIMPENDAMRFSAHLDNLGIGGFWYNVEGGVRINTTLIETSNGTVTHLNSAGSQLSTRMQDEFEAFMRPKFKSGDTWIFSGSLPSGFDPDAYQKAIALASEAGCTTVLDTRGAALAFGLRAKPTIIKPNLSELESYFGEEIRGVRHIALKAKRLVDMGVGYVFISLGADGMIAVHGNDCLLCAPPQISAIDTVGCGDALVAGVVVALERGFSFQESCRLGVACGTCKAKHKGPGVIKRDDVSGIMQEVRIEAV